MKASLLLAWALILQTPSKATTEPHYAVAIPAVLEHPREQKVCLQVSSLTEALHVTVTLCTKAHNLTLIEKTIEDPILFDCATFRVPAPTSEDEEVASVQVVGKGQVFSFEKSKKVLIRTLKRRTFVQTDKPMYKSGEIGEQINSKAHMCHKCGHCWKNGELFQLEDKDLKHRSVACGGFIGPCPLTLSQPSVSCVKGK